MPRAPTRGRIAVGAVAIAGLLALVLLAMGREPWCTCGRIALWHGVVDSAENSQHLFDWYSFTHLAHGFGLYALVTRLAPGASPGVRFLLAMAGEAAWEAIENTPFVIERYRAVTLARGYYGDSVVNALGDLATAALGFAFAARAPAALTVAAFVALEVFLAWAIRDNLTLNVVMLVFPIEAIEAWQQGAGG